MSKADRFRRLADAKPDESLPQNKKSEVIDKLIGVDPDAPSTEDTSNPIAETEDVTNTQNTEHVQSSNSLNMFNNDEQSDVIVTSNTEHAQSDVSKSPTKRLPTRVPEAIEEFEKRMRRPTVEQTHTRQTWLVNNELLRRLNKVARNQGRGFKTHLINYALERVLDELEGK